MKVSIYGRYRVFVIGLRDTFKQVGVCEYAYQFANSGLVPRLQKPPKGYSWTHLNECVFCESNIVAYRSGHTLNEVVPFHRVALRGHINTPKHPNTH